MKQVTIKVYQFDELSKLAQDKAIEEHGSFLDNEPEEYENEDGEMEEEYVEHDREQIIENIQINEYWFFADGEMANCITYVGKHPKAGITELKIGGEVFVIEP